MLRNFVTVCLVAAACGATLFTLTLNAQTANAQILNEPPKQTARQALIEMFLGKGPDDFVKHLPEETRHALIHKGDTAEGSLALRISEIGRQITAQGQHIETFDEGPSILVMEERGTKEKIEISVEHDSLMGESDEIELSIKHSKDGQETSLPVVPRFIFTLQQEKEIWRLTEVTAAAHMPLTDPDYLKGLRKLQNESNESMIQGRVSMIVGIEKAYAAQHPDQGFTCELSKVFQEQQETVAKILAKQGKDSGLEQDSDSATGYMVGASQQNEIWNGYRFTLSGCEGTPASSYVVTAAPTDHEPDADTKTFCADESGTLKFAVGGKPSSCISNGQPLNSVAVALPAEE